MPIWRRSWRTGATRTRQTLARDLMQLLKCAATRLEFLSLDIAHQLIVELDEVIFVFAGAKLDRGAWVSVHLSR